MTAYLFRIDLPTSRRQAVICVDAWYASVLKKGQADPERLRLSPTVWRGLARELSQPLPSSPLPQHSAVLTAVLEPEVRSRAQVRYMAVLPIDPAPHGLERRLDALHIGFGGLYLTLTGRLGWW